MSESNSQTGPEPESLCLECGLCCNGVLFADVKLKASDEPKTLRRLGVGLSVSGTRFPQPCAAFQQGRCRIYPLRPHQCRHFECLLLQSVSSGTTAYTKALQVVRRTKVKAEEVRSLLRQLGDTREALSLSKRFRGTARRLQGSALSEQQAERFGQLTLAVHELNLLLSQAFYPG